MSDGFLPLALLLTVTFLFLAAFSTKLQQANNQQRKTFNNDYIPPRSPLDIPFQVSWSQIIQMILMAETLFIVMHQKKDMLF